MAPPQLRRIGRIPANGHLGPKTNTMKCFGPRFGRTVIGRVIAFAAATLAILLGGCGDDGIVARLLLKPGHIIIERRPDAAYEKLFRDYVELCAASQFRAKLTGEGGIAGHAVMYLKGACREDDAPYPGSRHKTGRIAR